MVGRILFTRTYIMPLPSNSRPALRGVLTQDTAAKHCVLQGNTANGDNERNATAIQDTL